MFDDSDGDAIALPYVYGNMSAELMARETWSILANTQRSLFLCIPPNRFFNFSNIYLPTWTCFACQMVCLASMHA